MLKSLQKQPAIYQLILIIQLIEITKEIREENTLGVDQAKLFTFLA